MIENRIKRSLLWIEEHLDTDFPADQPARAACLSEYHFRRLFKAITGLSPGLYIKKRRLTRAAAALTETRQSVIEIALGGGYQTQESFTRAFHELFGVTPAQYRKNPTDISGLVQPPIDEAMFAHITTGGISMQPDIRARERFYVAGLGDDFEVGQGDEIGKLWERFNAMRKEVFGPPVVDYGVCRGALIHGAPGREFHYTAATGVPDDFLPPPGIEKIEIQAGSYAVFIHKGPVRDLKKTNHYIWKIWLPKSGYEPANAPDFERYDGRFDANTMTGEIEIWVPLKEIS